MKKIETIWHHILYSALANKTYRHTQKELANNFSYSLSTVNHALKMPTQIGAIRKTSKFFVLQNFQKLLYYWASVRNLEKDIIYLTFADCHILELEGLIPTNSIYATYTAARKLLGHAPADYSKIYFYSPKKDLDIVKKRFPFQKDAEPNITVLTKIPIMNKYGSQTTLIQTFVDIWNLKEWYSKDFINSLEEKINEILS